MPKDPPKKPIANTPSESHPNVEEGIRHRAYEIYEERGREDGHDLEDWLRAQAEIAGESVKAAVA